MRKLINFLLLFLSLFVTNAFSQQNQEISALEIKQANQVANLFLQEWKSSRDVENIFKKLFVNGVPNKCRIKNAQEMNVPDLPTDLLDQSYNCLGTDFPEKDVERFKIAYINFQLLSNTYYLQSRNLNIAVPTPTKEENLRSLFPPGAYELVAKDSVMSEIMLKDKDFIAKTPEDLQILTETLEKIASLYRAYILENPPESSLFYEGNISLDEQELLSGNFFEPKAVYAKSLPKCGDLPEKSYTLRKIIVKVPPGYWLVLTPVDGELKLFYIFLTSSF